MNNADTFLGVILTIFFIVLMASFFIILGISVERNNIITRYNECISVGGTKDICLNKYVLQK